MASSSRGRGRPTGTGVVNPFVKADENETYDYMSPDGDSAFQSLYKVVEDQGGAGGSHNKSKSDVLSVIAFDKYSIEFFFGYFQAFVMPNMEMSVRNVVPGSPCVFTHAADGRVSVPGSWTGSSGQSVKVAHAYQVVALFKFGPVALLKCTPTKSGSGKNALTISHICGARNCCNPDHLLLEPKHDNDGRTSCHTVLTTWLANGHSVKEFQQKGCRHHPSCGSVVTSAMCSHVDPVPVRLDKKMILKLKNLTAAVTKNWGNTAFESVEGLTNLIGLGSESFSLEPVLNEGFSLRTMASTARSTRVASKLKDVGASLTDWAKGTVGILSPFKSPRPRHGSDSDDDSDVEGRPPARQFRGPLFGSA